MEFNHFNPSQFTGMLIFLSLSTQNKLLSNESKANDHAQPFEMKNKILPTCFQGNYQDSLGEFSSTPSGLFGVLQFRLPVIICALTALQHVAVL